MHLLKKDAGLVLGAGGFGCVFYPALKCKNKSKRTKGISKLGYINEIDKEIELYKMIKPIIIKIKNYENFFLISDIKSCQPSKLTRKDKDNLEKCHILKKYNIDKENINKNLMKFKIINIPYGGKDLFDILEKLNINIFNSFKFYNSKFYNLLRQAIIPMNNLDLFHNDIKSANLLLDINKNKNQIKIIDWGLASIFKNDKIPFQIRNRSIQYNLPFSTILLFQDFQQIYSKFLIKYKNDFKNNITLIKTFCNNYINTYFLNGGHMEYILKYLFPLILDNNNLTKEEIEFIGISFIIDYLSNILINFTDFNNNKFNEIIYYKKVFIKNSDIWGFLTLYLDILLITKSINRLTIKIKDLVKKYLYTLEFSIKPIPLNKLLNDIKQLNQY